MPNSDQLAGLHQPKLMLCSGRDCTGKYQAALQAIEAAASEHGVDIESVGCQGTCSGPTAVVVIDGQHRWFERLRKRKQQEQLVALAARELPTPSRRLLSHELTGEKRRAAAKKLGVA